MPTPRDHIKHIIVLMLENRSFDHMLGFHTIPWPRIPGDRIDGLTGQEFNLDSRGNEIVVTKDARYAGDYRADPGHHFPDVTEQIFEEEKVPSSRTPTMGGFVTNYGKQPGSSFSASGRVMKCFDPVKLPALKTLANEFAVCDRWFSSVPGPTLPNRAFAHLATSFGHVDMNPVAYWNALTLYDRLAEHNVSSRVYSHDGNTLAFMFKSLLKRGGRFLGSYGDFLSDLKGNKLPRYCFVEPRFNDWYDESTHRYYIANDQHPDNNVAEGELLLQEVYQAIRKSRYWEKCLFVITYDEHGGFYDHVAPPRTVPSGHEKPGSDFDFTRLGVRVPAVLVSPYIERGTIMHDIFDHTSLAATARVVLAPNMAPLTDRDKQANDLARALTLNVPRDAPKKLDITGQNDLPVRRTDVDPNTHGSATLSDQQRNQVLAVYMADLDQPVGRRVIGRRVLEDVNTEQKAAEYIRAVAKAKGIL